MRRPLTWLWCFAAGILLGFFLGRGWDGPETGPISAPPTDGAPRVAKESGSAAPVARTDPRLPDAHSASAVRPPPADAPGTGAVPPVPAPAAAVPAAAAVKLPFEPAVDSGVVTAVDAGEVFNKQIARPSTPDQPNPLGDAHRALEREPRDDGWAYSMEAELQNSMLNETSAGKFTVEHVECRSTLCEVRVSGNGEQADAVRSWSDSLRNDPVNQQLFMNVSSSISSHERVDAIYIFRRPAKKP